MGENKIAHGALVGKPEGRKTTGVEVRIKMDLKEIGWRGVDWIYLAQDSDKWPTREYGTKSSYSITGGEFLTS